MTKNTFETQDVFTTPIYAKTFKNVDNKKIIKYLNKIKHENHNVGTSAEGGIHTQYFFYPFPTVTETLNDEIHKFIKEGPIKDFEVKGTPTIHNSWFIINNKGDFNKPHNHPPYWISGIYYVKAEKDCGDLIFNNNAEMNNYATSYHNYNKYNSKEYRVIPETGMCILFPSWINHFVTPNKTNKDRIAYSFNI